MKRLLSALSASVLLVTAIISTPFAAAVNNNPTAADRVIDLSKSQLLITSDNTAMTYDTEGGILKLSAQQWYWDNKPIRAVGSKSTWCKEIGLKYEDGALAQLESGKRYAVTLNYTFVNNMQLFHHTCEKNGIVHDNRKIFEYLSTFETKCDNVQLSLFDKDFAGKSPNGI